MIGSWRSNLDTRNGWRRDHSRVFNRGFSDGVICNKDGRQGSDGLSGLCDLSQLITERFRMIRNKDLVCGDAGGCQDEDAGDRKEGIAHSS